MTYKSVFEEKAHSRTASQDSKVSVRALNTGVLLVIQSLFSVAMPAARADSAGLLTG